MGPSGPFFLLIVYYSFARDCFARIFLFNL